MAIEFFLLFFFDYEMVVLILSRLRRNWVAKISSLCPDVQRQTH